MKTPPQSPRIATAETRRASGRASRTRADRRWAGQSLAEFALVLPVMLALLGMGVDWARLFFAWIDLESATRDAAQLVASDPNLLSDGSGYYDPNDTTNYCASYPCSSAPTTDAKSVLDAATGKTFTKSSSQSDCSTAKVWATLASPDTSITDGGSKAYPVAKAQVTACFPFKMFVAYPWLPNGTWFVRSDKTISTVVGR